ncbi:MAG: HAD-IIIA family hydrolase [Firmicutes bacterium]|nr:HAD-IIIA family hydrolase [Bacillota bacterium]
MIRNILFDFDGTLVNTNDVIIASWQHTYQTYLGHEVSVERITRCFGEPLLLTMAREFPEVDPEDAAVTYRTFQVKEAEKLVRLFPGIVDMLKALKEAGCQIGIVTSRTRESALRYMNQLNITSYFDDMVNCDDTDVHKPNPEPLLLAMKKLGATAQDSIMVGDSPFDIKCANNAGVRSALVDWRITSDENQQVGKAVADFTIKTPMDLVELIERL